MIVIPSLKDRKVAVMGLGIAGLATVRALLESGARVMAWDDNADSRDAVEKEGAEIADLMAIDWQDVACLILSPGIPHTFPTPHPIADAARAADVEIICDVELLGRAQPDATYIGITGTNGKSTTTALVGHILDAAGKNTEVGGNLGPPVLGMRPLGKEGIYVLELSSYQLERMSSIRFDVAAFLNISADHLDRHGGLKGYIEAKRNIFKGQGAGDTAVVGIDDADARKEADAREKGDARLVRVSGEGVPEGGVGVEDGRLIDTTGGRAEILDLSEIRTLPGSHNHQNAASAYAICRAAGVDADTIAAAIRTFPGLPHRQELVATIDGVSWVNDSKATNTDATARALSSYERIFWIAGGLAKDGGYAALEPWLDNVAHAFLIGEAAEQMANWLGTRVPSELSGQLGTAVTHAHSKSQGDAGAVVLLSPACASFDQFKNFGERGDTFRKLARDLAAAREERAAS